MVFILKFQNFLILNELGGSWVVFKPVVDSQLPFFSSCKHGNELALYVTECLSVIISSLVGSSLTVKQNLMQFGFRLFHIFPIWLVQIFPWIFHLFVVFSSHQYAFI